MFSLFYFIRRCGREVRHRFAKPRLDESPGEIVTLHLRHMPEIGVEWVRIPPLASRALARSPRDCNRVYWEELRPYPIYMLPQYNGYYKALVMLRYQFDFDWKLHYPRGWPWFRMTILLLLEVLARYINEYGPISGWQNLHPDVKSVIYVNRQSTKRTGLLEAFSIIYALIVQQEKYRRCRRERFESVKGPWFFSHELKRWSERKTTKRPYEMQHGLHGRKC